MNGNSYAAEQLEHQTRKAEKKRKRIILEIPENTYAGIFCYICRNRLAGRMIDTNDLKEGNVIVCDPEE